MDKLKKALEAAAAILKFAADEAKAFIEKNTPESALLAALALDYQQWQSGSLNGTQFAFAAMTALIAFAVAEANKDKTNP